MLTAILYVLGWLEKHFLRTFASLHKHTHTDTFPWCSIFFLTSPGPLKLVLDPEVSLPLQGCWSDYHWSWDLTMRVVGCFTLLAFISLGATTQREIIALMSLTLSKHSIWMQGVRFPVVTVCLWALSESKSHRDIGLSEEGRLTL